MADARDFAADRAVCEQATKGPWRAQWQSSGMGHRILFPAECESYCGRVFRLEDAEFVAAARLGWPAALQEIELLRGAMQSQDNRERAAGERCGVDYNLSGCDWPDAVADEVEVLRAEIERLRAAIRQHMNERGDDRCHLSDGMLYAILPEGDTRPEYETAVTLENCARYIECRQTGREYVSPEREIERLRAEVLSLSNRLRDASLGGQGSHWEGCWKSHIDCARAEVERLRSESAYWEREFDRVNGMLGELLKQLETRLNVSSENATLRAALDAAERENALLREEVSHQRV